MNTYLIRSLAIAVLLLAVQEPCGAAAPYCAKPGANNLILASAAGDLTAPGWGGILVLHGVDTHVTFRMRHCSVNQRKKCYYATNVQPGNYYIEQIMPEGDNHLEYPVSGPALWFPVIGKGVDYIGSWTIKRHGQAIWDLQVSYALDDLDEAVELCGVKGKPLYLDRLKSAPIEIVD